MQNLLFLTLLLAHAIADYPLQTTRVYQFKVRSFAGIILHVLIFFFTALALVILTGFSLNKGLLAFLFLLFILHVAEDKLKICCLGKSNFFWYVMDQLIHIACIALLYFLPLNLVLKSSALIHILQPLYLAGIGIIYSSFASGIGISFFHKTHKADPRCWQEVIEMGIWATLFFIFKPYAFYIFGVGLLAKLLLMNAKRAQKGKNLILLLIPAGFYFLIMLLLIRGEKYYYSLIPK